MPTKSDFNKIFNELRKWGYTVINFSDKRALRRGMKDWVDYVIFNDQNIAFIELKIGADKLSGGQAKTQQKLVNISFKNDTMTVWTIKEVPQAKELVDYLMRR